MYISKEEKDYLIRELQVELHARLDGGRKNLIVPECPYCGKSGGKFGIYVGPEKNNKIFGMGHCFSCGHTCKDLNRLLEDIGRPDLQIKETAQFTPIEVPEFFGLEEDEIDDELAVIEMPESWKRCYKNPYLKSRGFTVDDYAYFPVGTTRGLNFKFDNYVIFPIYDNNDIVGYVARHTWSKDEIDAHNVKAKLNGKYQIRRYNNSIENDFVKLLYNYDAVIEDETDTVILVEGVFDVIALTRKLELYDNHRIVPVCTFGKKISDTQIYKLQSKGVRDIIVGYDTDASDAINVAADKLNEYFENVLIAKLVGEGKDWDEASFWDIYDTFSESLYTPIEYKLSNVDGKI
jgi:DNA primase